jgi:NTE family protein
LCCAALYDVAKQHKSSILSKSTEKQVLVLQGGGALGSYQAGAYEALAEAGNAPEWLAGISIGAINAAIIAGNLPENRVKRLKAFWERMSSGLQGVSLIPGDGGRTLFNEMSSWTASLFGVPGFFSPRLISPLFSWPGTEGALSYYDTSPLRDTLNELVDFDLLNNGKIRVSVGAVNVETGNFRFFDTTKERITADHILASGALPPGFPPVKIDGEYYWDGGLVSNTPLNHVIDNAGSGEDLCIYQVDLFSSRGDLPKTIFEAAEREKEIRYSSRTRMSTATAETELQMRNAFKNLLKKLPKNLRDDPDVKFLEDKAKAGAITVMHIINRPASTETQTKDYEFSRLSMEEHWASGYDDVMHSLNSKAWKQRTIPAQGMVTFDHGRKPKHEFV